jgi:AcrR family transcriptional regulator
MGTKERRERERDAVRTRILDAARELFAAQGYDGVSMRAIAEKIEYSPTAIYQYFRDKETLVTELCHADFLGLAEELAESQQIEDPVERLLRCGHAYARFATTHPNHYRLMFIDPLPARYDEAEMAEYKGKPEFDAYALLLGQVKAVAAAGRLRDAEADPELVAQTLWAGIHGVVSLEIALGCEKCIEWRPLEERVRAMLGALTTGVFAGGH